MLGLIATNRLQLLPGLGLGKAEFMGKQLGVLGEREAGRTREVEVGRSSGRRSVISSVTVMDWA